MFEVWDQNGHATGLTLQALRIRVGRYQDEELMVRYSNKLGLPTTLFLTVRQGVAYQRFKAGSPKLNWNWLAQAGNGHSVHYFINRYFSRLHLAH